MVSDRKETNLYLEIPMNERFLLYQRSNLTLGLSYRRDSHFLLYLNMQETPFCKPIIQ